MLSPSPRRLSARSLLLISGLVVAALLSVPLWGSSNLMRTLVEFITLLALAQMWNLLAGYAGMVSVGQQAWIGLGGYALIVFADDLKINMFLAVFLGGAVAALIALPTAALVFRLRAGYFAIGTWVVAEVFRLLVASSTDWLKGGSGRTLAAAGLIERGLRENLTYWLAALIGVGAVVLVYYLMRSRAGLGLTAIRDSESAAASVGVDTHRIKLLVYVICAFGTGVTGGLIYLNVLRITPDASFTVQWTAFMIFIVVIGGLGTVEGPILGAVIFFFIREYLSNFGGWSLILLGLVAVVMMLVAPQGLWGLLQERFQLELFPVRRRLDNAVVLAACSQAASTPAPLDENLPTKVPTPTGVVASQALACTDSQGEVDFIIIPVNLTTLGETLDFTATMDTHSVDLSWDLAAQSILSTDTGLEVKGLSWPVGGGHHLEGTLSFPTRTSDGKPLLEGAKKLTLTIKDAGAPERLFEWEISQ